MTNIGDVRITFLEPTAGGETERRVLFDGGLDVDFAILPHAKLQDMIKHGLPPGVAGVFRRGVRVLLDREGLAARLEPADAEAVSPGSIGEADFVEVINDFWYHAVLTAKKLRRRELWYARACADGYMKRLLLKMVEWHARITTEQHEDVWHDGRFLEQWADPRILEGLRGAFAHYDHSDVRRALVATMDLFRWLAKETADLLAYRYPTAVDEYATESANTLLSEDSETETGDGA